jgi:putative membrane protein
MKAIILPAAVLLIAFSGCKKDDDNNDSGLNDTDRTFMTNAAYSNNAEVDAGTIAASRGNMGMVRDFGTMMAADHSTAQAELVTLGTQVGYSNLPATPDSAHIRISNMLKTMSGRAFDSSYMKQQVVDHQNTISLMQNEIANGRDQRVKNFATTKLPIIQHHKHMADSIVAANGF